MSVEGGDPLALASLTDQGNYKVSQVMPAQPAMPASEADGDAQNAKTVDDSKGDEGSDADAPGCFIRFIAYHPYWMLFISFFIALVMGVIPFLMGMNAFASQEGGRFDAYGMCVCVRLCVYVYMCMSLFLVHLPLSVYIVYHSRRLLFAPVLRADRAPKTIGSVFLPQGDGPLAWAVCACVVAL